MPVDAIKNRLSILAAKRSCLRIIVGENSSDATVGSRRQFLVRNPEKGLLQPSGRRYAASIAEVLRFSVVLLHKITNY